jgi:hypothetical protein
MYFILTKINLYLIDIKLKMTIMKKILLLVFILIVSFSCNDLYKSGDLNNTSGDSIGTSSSKKKT